MDLKVDDSESNCTRAKPEFKLVSSFKASSATVHTLLPCVVCRLDLITYGYKNVLTRNVFTTHNVKGEKNVVHLLGDQKTTGCCCPIYMKPTFTPSLPTIAAFKCIMSHFVQSDVFG